MLSLLRVNFTSSQGIADGNCKVWTHQGKTFFLRVYEIVAGLIETLDRFEGSLGFRGVIRRDDSFQLNISSIAVVFMGTSDLRV